MHKRFLITASLLAGIAVILRLRRSWPEKIRAGRIVIFFETGVRYQFYHSIALLIAAFAGRWFSSRWTSYAGYCFIAGIALFSGSLYALTLLKATDNAGLSGIGIITPIGGLFFVAGRLALARAFGELKMKNVKVKM